MKALIFVMLVAVLALAATPAVLEAGGAPKKDAAAAPATSLQTDEQKTLYTLGRLLAGQFDLKPAEVEFVKKGLEDVAAGAASQADINVYGPKVQELATARANAKADAA